MSRTGVFFFLLCTGNLPIMKRSNFLPPITTKISPNSYSLFLFSSENYTYPYIRPLISYLTLFCIKYFLGHILKRTADEFLKIKLSRSVS